ncbi:MAG TPA: hypothetical protein VF795_03785, partial [Desulfuromonadaceae bacterium]
SKIGDISGYLTTAELSARDQSTAGGAIDISVTGGDVIVKSGGTLNFAGGGFNYAMGNQAVPKLLCGTTAYDLSKAPEWLSYSAVLGTQQVAYTKYGVTDTYKGLYFGGGNAVNDYADGYSQGSNAGTLSLRASSVVMEGNIIGKATPGPYQTQLAELADKIGNQNTLGLKMPAGGTLVIGDSLTSTDTVDYRLGDVVLQQNVDPGDVNVLSPAQTTTYLSTAKLSGAGLSSLTILSNTSVTTARGSSLTLAPGSSFTVNARRIEDNGDITIHGGKVTFALTDNITSEHYKQTNNNPDPVSTYIDLQVPERIFVADGSSIDVSGERVNNALPNDPAALANMNYTKGGSISLTDTRELGTAVIVKSGAVLDVSGGYGISSTGKITGDDAGSVKLLAPTVVLDGTLRGFSLPGYAGGAITLQATQVNVVRGAPSALLDDTFGADSALPDNVTGQVTVGDRSFKETGFSSFTLNSYYNLNIPGVTFLPSYVKLAAPTAAKSSAQTGTLQNVSANGAAGSETITVSADYVGPSSFSATAGVPLFTASDASRYYNPADNPANDTNYSTLRVYMTPDATISMAPQGKVSLTGPVVDIGGTVSAPGGTIAISASSTYRDVLGDLTIESSGKLSAAGYNKINTSTIDGVSVGPTPVNAGSVTLNAAGSLTLQEGSRIDVSGSQAVANMQAAATGPPTAVTVAGNPGTVSLSFVRDYTLGGEIDAAS